MRRWIAIGARSPHFQAGSDAVDVWFRVVAAGNLLHSKGTDMSNDLGLRTGLYIHRSTTVLITPRDTTDGEVELCRYNRPVMGLARGKHALEPGIYQIVSRGPLTIEGEHLEVVATINNKDPWPKPKLDVVALEPGATAEQIQAFFANALAIAGE